MSLVVAGLENTEEDTETQAGNDGFETLSTGLSNFDQAFERRGIKIGSVITLLSTPACSSDTLLANMMANRPGFYYTFGRSVAHIEEKMGPIENVNSNEVRVQTLESSKPLDALRQKITDISVPTGGVIIIDPVNEFENADATAYRQLLYQIQQKVKRNDGLAIIHGLQSDETTAKNRWLSKYVSDTVLSVYQERADEAIKEFLAVEKLYPGQELVSRDARVFQLNVQPNIDISTSRNISP